MTLFAWWLVPSSGSAVANGESGLLAPGTGQAGVHTLTVAGQPPAALLLELDRVEPTASIRIDTAEPGILEGTLRRRSDRILVLVSPSGTREIPIDAVQKLWVRGRATRRGAIVGGVSLGILGAIAGPLALGAEYLSGSSSRPDTGEYFGAAGIGALAGGAIGALVGAGVGAAFAKWHQRFP